MWSPSRRLSSTLGRTMNARRLGETELQVTPIGLGLAAIGRPAYINLGRERDLPTSRTVEEMRARAHQLLDDALRRGVRYFDAARSYGLAEEFLGSWLRSREPLPVPITCGSKWGYRYIGDWRMDAPVHEVKDHSISALRAQYRETLTLLGGHLNLYQVHSATLESGVLENREVLAELVRLQEAGLVIGITVSGPRQADTIRRAMTVEVDGVNPLSTVQATWNLLESSAGPALAEAHNAGWGVLAKEGLANGRLLDTRDQRLEPLREVAAAHEVGADAVALAVILAQEWADVALSGAVTVGQLDSNVGAEDLKLSAAELDALGALSEPADRYWRERSALQWR
jgi:aryl-alcohol dehydrogenase-like predicted oxidoreductase